VRGSWCQSEPERQGVRWLLGNGYSWFVNRDSWGGRTGTHASAGVRPVFAETSDQVRRVTEPETTPVEICDLDCPS
jgi:hypothetical protein